MDSIIYLLRKNIKNAVIDTFRHPLKLIVYLLIGASIVYAVVRGFTFSGAIGDRLDIRILYGVYFALLFFLSIPIMLKGLSTGSTFFTMGDVNNLFVAPINNKRLLVYGIGKQLAASLFLVVCFSAYGSFAIRMFDLSLTDAVMLVAGIILMLFMVQVITLLLFCVCSAKPRRAVFLRFVIIALPLFAIGSVAVYMFTNGLTLEHLYASISQSYLEYIPVIGWVHGLVFGVIENNTFGIIFNSSLLLLSCVLSLVIFFVTKLDYYEDVLSMAESYYEFKDHIRTGKVSDGYVRTGKIDLRKTGIRKGSGASTIFYKNLREGSRRSRFMFFNINTLVLLGVTAVIGLAMKNFFSAPWKITIIYLANTVICSYIQFFFSAAGDWVKELNKPYIFLIPDNPVRKLIMAGATSIIKPFIDGAICYAFLWILVGGYFPDLIISALVYGSFGCIYIASNILAQRIVGISGNRGVFITFYMGIMVLLMIPGIVLGLLLLSSLTGHFLTVIAASVIGVPVLLWNLLISFVIFMLCRNLMNNIE